MVRKTSAFITRLKEIKIMYSEKIIEKVLVDTEVLLGSIVSSIRHEFWIMVTSY